MSRTPYQKALLPNKGKQYGKFIEEKEKRRKINAAVDCEASVSQTQRSLNVARPSNILPSKSKSGNSIFASCTELEKIFANFQLPDFPKGIQNKLRKGMVLNSDEKKIVLEDLGEAIRKFTYYPLVAQLDLVIERFLKKYPHLLAICKPEISMQYWVRQLQENFVEFGMKMPKKMEDRGCKEKLKRSRHCKDKVDKMTQTHQHAVYQDLSLVIQEMKKEWLEPIRNTEIINRFMRTTYDTRRSFIVQEKPTVYEVKERYPALFDDVGIKNEFAYIIGKDKFDVFNRNLKQFSDVIFNLHGVDKVIQKEILIASNKQNHFDKRVIPILLIPSLLDESLDFLCFSNKPFDTGEISPWIQCNATLQEVLKGIGVYRIFAENILICEPSDLIGAMFCLVACYWAFFIVYPARSLKTLQFFETFLLEIEEYYEEEEKSLDEDVVKLADILKGLQRRKKIKT